MTREESHDAHCEREYTANGFIFIDCNCALREVQAKAWDEGFIARLGDTPRYKTRAEWGNPYRSQESTDE